MIDVLKRKLAAAKQIRGHEDRCRAIEERIEELERDA